MIKKILEIIKDVTMTKGVFLQDKSFKYDTVFFNANFLLEHTIGNKICLGTENEKKIIGKFEKTFNLSANSDANKNYFLEGTNLLAYANIIKKDEDGNYEILHRDILEFVASSIENAYILLYLVAYKAFVNDGIWDTYVEFLNTETKENKESILKTLRTMICSKSESVGKIESVWAGLKTKYPLMVLGLANKSFVITRGDDVNPPKIKEQIITPQDVSANVSGTRTTTVKDNDYIKSFRLTYVISQLKDYLAESTLETKVNFDKVERLTGGTNVILYGVPGAGKSWTIDHEYMDEETTMKKVVFHPDYTYSDFVGQILPKKVNDSISYDFVPGPFTKIMKDAYRNPDKKFILAIEEINRGNAPAIFGDIFQLLDRDENGRSSYEIVNADIARIVYGDENHVVYIPSNLSILCTMNTSDQNVFTLDTAFQRRWNMRLIENSFRKDSEEEKKFAEHPILDSDIKWESFCSAINAQILEKNQNMTSSEDKRLGTHFVNLDDLNYYDEESASTDTEKLKIRLKNRRFPEKVIKYLWDDAFKFYRDEIFKAELNSLEKVIKVFTEKKKNDRFEIFKDNIRAAIFDENSKQ